jgi:hypothetical protein
VGDGARDTSNPPDTVISNSGAPPPGVDPMLIVNPHESRSMQWHLTCEPSAPGQGYNRSSLTFPRSTLIYRARRLSGPSAEPASLPDSLGRRCEGDEINLQESHYYHSCSELILFTDQCMKQAILDAVGDTCKPHPHPHLFSFSFLFRCGSGVRAPKP